MLAVAGRLIGNGDGVLRVAMASRRPLAMRLARERATGRVTELGRADLAFSAAECEKYLRLARGAEPQPEEVDALMEQTEGWPLGIALAVAGAPAGARRPSRSLLDEYFEEEVLGALAPARRRELLAAAMAPDLEVAEAAGLAPGGPDLHPLFNEFLRRRFVEEVPPTERRVLAGRLADALESAGRGVDAVGQRIASEEWDRAAEAIAREGGALVRRAPETVEGWLAALPAGHAEQPAFRLLAGQLAHGRGTLREAVEHCRAAVAGFDSQGAPPFMRFAARFALADAYLGIGDLHGAAALGDTLDEPEADGDLTARAIGVLAAIALALQGRFEDGRALRDRAFSDPVAAVIRGQSPVFEGYWVDLPAGRLDDALVHLDQGITVFERVDPFGRLPYVLLFKFAVHEERGEYLEALALAARGRDLARQTGLAGWVGAGTSIRIASLRARLGDVSGAETELADVTPGSSSWGTWELDATRAAIAAARGDAQDARASAERAARELGDHMPWFERMRCAAMLAPTLVRAGQPGRAREIVEATLAARPPASPALACEWSWPGSCTMRATRAARWPSWPPRGRRPETRLATSCGASGRASSDRCGPRWSTKPWSPPKPSARWPTRFRAAPLSEPSPTTRSPRCAGRR